MVAFLHDHSSWVDHVLLDAGALLPRGFPIATAVEFEACVRVAGANLLDNSPVLVCEVYWKKPQ